MKRRILRLTAILFFLGCAGSLDAQELITIYGYVADAANGEVISNAQVMVPGTFRGTTTNHRGFFSLQFRTDSEFRLQVQCVGYDTAFFSISKDLWPNVWLDVRLARKVIELSEVVFEQLMDRSHLQSTELGVWRMRADQMRKVPMVGGESDLFKVMQTLPGVMSGQELSNGIYVRGGSFDQNLYLLDGVTVYNPNHLFGFFGVFNSDALKEVELMKGTIPPQHGGRLSSVAQFTMKEGNRERFAARGGIGMVSSRLTLEGPLGSSRRGSFMISGRRTYIDPILSLGNQKSQSGEETKFYFYDLNLKTNYDLSTDDQIFLAGYFGRDHMDVTQENAGTSDRLRLRWGNAAYTVRHQRVWTPDLFTYTSLVYSQYQSDFLRSGTSSLRKEPAIQDAQVKSDGEWHVSQEQTATFGASFTKHWFQVFSGIARNSDEPQTNLESYEIALYAAHDWKLNEKWRTHAGARAAYFHMGDFWQFDPRLAVRFQINETTSVKAAYTRMHQFVHFLSALNFTNAGDIVYPSTPYLRPEVSHQWTTGITWMTARGWECNTELYYKTLRQLPSFKQNFSSADPTQLRENVFFGKGWAYGFEIGMSRAVGQVTGWWNYSYAKSYRQFAERNQGRKFSPKFDRTHQINAVAEYTWNQKWKLGATFVLASGQPITLPKQRYDFNDQDGRNENYDGVIDYGRIYDTRLPWYNRLDISIAYTFAVRKLKGELLCSVYNVYNYANPLWIDYNEDTGRFTQTTLGMLPTVGLSFSY